MSRHTFHTEHNGRPVEVAAGWDRPLQGFFMTVLYTDDPEDQAVQDYEYAFNNLTQLLPHPRTFDGFADILASLAIALPEGMTDDIIKDGRVNMGNKIRNWST